MPQDLTAIKREKLNKEISTGMIQTNGMGQRTVSGKESYSKTPTGNLVTESSKSSSHKQSGK